KGKALEIPHSPEKKPVSCLTDWHYNSNVAVFLSLGIRGPLGSFATFNQDFYLTLVQTSGNLIDPL
ncbi:hypothetical protein, partial [Enterobacter cloacae complex sp. P47BA]|uniref:hypothetical protein n=1 Tax=Enterobacter cloacae complex sp. P47BA TaxID=2779540 RepID=UPI001D04D2BC